MRIGRQGLAEISLPYDFISSWHAILDLDAGAVLLWDLGSRNGTSLGSPPTKLAPQGEVDLRQHGMSFSIGPLHFSLKIVNEERTSRERDRGGPMLSSVTGKPRPGARNDGAHDQAMSPEVRALTEEHRGD